MALEDPADRSAGQISRAAGLNREILAGIFLVACAAIGYYAALPLDAGSLSGVGSGLMPKAVSLGIGGFGVFLIVIGVLGHTDRVEGFSFRGVIFVLGGILAFAGTVRPLGLLVAGPLAMLISSMADPDTRPGEILLFSAFMTGCCYLLFKLLLNLPIPVLPPLLGY